MEKQIQPKLDLIKSSLSYKIHIPLYVEKKIRILCREIHNVEWSGVLFYRINGSFEDGTLEIECVDIFQMDEGSSGYTEFDMSADVMHYMVEHPELLSEDVYQGLVHSHNNMATFFSSTDTGTLLTEGSDVNHFVSLIVNNAGKYTAGITRRVSVVQKVLEEYTYPSWKGESKSGNREFTASKTYVQWFNLDINVDEVPKEDESEVLERIKEVRQFKASRPKPINTPYKSPATTFPSNSSFMQEISKKEEKKEEKKWEKDKGWEKVNCAEVQTKLFNDDEEDFDVDYNLFHFSEDTVEGIVKQLITLSLVLPKSEAINTAEWAKNMEKIFDNRFEDLVDFETVAVNIVDFLLNEVKDDEALLYLTPMQAIAVLANDVKTALSKLPENKYISSLMSICDDYIF